MNRFLQTRHAHHALFLFLMMCALLGGCIISSDTGGGSDKPPIEIDASLLDFGDTLETASFTVTFPEGGIEWSITEKDSTGWCTFRIDEKESSAIITVSVNRATLLPGKYSSSLLIKWATGSRIITIRMIVPEVINTKGTIIIDTPIPR